MDVGEAISGRRSIRRYSRRDVPQEVLKVLLEKARLAPSAANRQPWEIIVVTEEKSRKELMPICKNMPFVSTCPVFLAAVEDIGQRWAKIDIAIAFDHLSLAAYEAGLGTCWVGAFDRERMNDYFRLPEDRSVAVCMALGYPDENPEAGSRKRFEDLFYWESYGNKGD